LSSEDENVNAIYVLVGTAVEADLALCLTILIHRCNSSAQLNTQVKEARKGTCEQITCTHTKKKTSKGMCKSICVSCKQSWLPQAI